MNQSNPTLAEAQRLLSEGTVSHGIPFTPPSLDELIAQARADLNLEATTAQDGIQRVEASNPAAANALLAEGARLQKIEVDAKKARERITATLAELAGTPTGDVKERILTVHGADVFAVRVTGGGRALNLDLLGATFPDTPDNAEMWITKDTSTSRNYL